MLYQTTFSQFCENNTFSFHAIAENFADIHRIHPLKQKELSSLANNESVQDLCKSIIVFGSSISAKCNSFSDIDLAVELHANTDRNQNTTCRLITHILKSNFDLLWIDDHLKSQKIYKNIQKGAKIL
jgi:predicted nucleotidyltransferase